MESYQEITVSEKAQYRCFTTASHATRHFHLSHLLSALGVRATDLMRRNFASMPKLLGKDACTFR